MNSQSDLEKSPEGLVVTAADLETRAVSELILEMTGDNADGMEEHEDIEGANPTSDASVLLEGKDKKENRKSRAAMSTNVPDILSAKAAIATRNQSLDPTLLAEASQPVTNQRKVSTMSAPGAFAASPSPGVASEDDEASNVSTSDDEEPRSNQATTIVSADLVDEEQMNLEREASFRRRMLVNTVKATEVTVTNENETSSFFQQWKLTILSVVGVLALVATGLGIALSRSDGDGAGLSDTEFLHELLLPVSGEALLEEGSPQSKALEWLLYKDPMDLPIQSTNSSTLLERYVMVVLYYSTGGPEWDDQLGFLTNRSICEWPNINQDESTATTSNEVDCGDRGTVVKIRIESNNMNGTIVSELGALSDLEIISLSNGNLHGTLPVSLADPPKLNFIQFVGQQLTGPLPSSFNNFPSLEILSVHNNALSGSIPDGLVFGADLEILDLSKNDFRGTIPAFNTQSGLRMVFLEENDLEGPIPSTLYTQPKLEILSLSNNRLNGTIAPQIRGMADLNLFLGHDNYFTGSIPSELGSLRALRELNLSSNDMTRGIPSQLGGLFQLTTLDLSSNYLTGMIPKELGEARALVKLSLKSNALTGVLPVSFASNTVIGGLETAFCSRSTQFTAISADCGGEESQLECSCCTECCDDTTGNCITNNVGNCMTNAGKLEREQDRDPECSCPEDGLSVSCSDGCSSCDLHGTVCAESKEYGFSFDESGNILTFKNTIEYVMGRNDTVVFESGNFDDQPGNCRVSVNGEICRSCSNVQCKSGFEGFLISCDNLQEPRSFNSCEETFDTGYLEVFFLFDSSLVDGCPLKLDRV